MRENPMFSGISRLHLMDQAKERVKYTKEKHDQVPRRHKESAERKTSELVELCFQEPILEKEVVEINFKYKGKLDIVSKYKVNRLYDNRFE